MKKIADIQDFKNRLSNPLTDDLLTDLLEYIRMHPDSDEGYFLLGNLYRRKEDWQDALNSYQSALDINPNSPAKIAYQAILEVLEFYNKDMFNQ